MASAIPKADVSLAWARCGTCGATHPSHVPHPPTDTWLVLVLCPSCRPANQFYCRTHRDRRALAVVPTAGDDAGAWAGPPDSSGLDE